MNTFKTTSLMAAMIAAALLSACSKDGFQTLTNTGNNSQGSNSDQGTGGTPKPPSAYDKMSLDTYVEGGNYGGQQVVALDKANNALLLFIPLPSMGSITVTPYIDIPEIKGVKIATVMDSQQKARVAISIPLKLLVKDKVSLPPATTLPGGRAIPGMPSGEMPSLALGLNQNSNNKIYLYFGVNAVGIFVESPFFPPYFGITAPIRNSAGTRTLGSFTIVPKADPYNGGLFLAFQLPNDLAKIIDDHLSGIIN